MKIIGVFVAFAFLPFTFAWWNVNSPTTVNKPQGSYKKDPDHDYWFPTPQAVTSCIITRTKPQPTPWNILKIFKKESMVPMVNCTITHYTLYTVEQQARLVNDCFAYHYQGAQFRLPACTHLLEANQRNDKRYPEFVEMRKQFAKLVTKVKEEDTFLVNSCFSALLKDDWTQASCQQFNMTPVFPANTTEPSRREAFQKEVFEDRLKSTCTNLAKPEAASKLCALFNENRVADCFFASVKNSFCKTVQRGPPVGISATMQYYRTLHHMYNELKRQANWEHGRLLDCIENHRNGREEKCRGLNWDRREPKTRMEAKTLALYDRLAQLPVPTTTLAPTTLAPTTSVPMSDADRKDDLALAHFCLEALLDDDWDQDACEEFQRTTIFSANPSVPTERETFRRNAFDELLWAYCSSNEYKSETAENHCQIFEMKKIFDCLNSSIKSPFCDRLAQFPPPPSSDDESEGFEVSTNSAA